MFDMTSLALFPSVTKVGAQPIVALAVPTPKPLHRDSIFTEDGHFAGLLIFLGYECIRVVINRSRGARGYGLFEIKCPAFDHADLVKEWASEPVPVLDVRAYNRAYGSALGLVRRAERNGGIWIKEGMLHSDNIE